MVMAEEEEDDFTFPTAPEERRDVAARLGDPGSAAPGLWPFAAPAATAAPVKEEEDDDDENRMDMLWDDTAAAASATRSGAKAAAAKAKPAPADDKDEQERMDLLWESFNEELLLLRSKPGKHHPEPAADSWYLCPSSTSDAESEGEASSAVSTSSPRYGCAPTMLRASSRAGGAGRFCGSPTTPRRTRSGGWALLLRLFRRLFAVDNKAAPPPRRRGIHAP